MAEAAERWGRQEPVDDAASGPPADPPAHEEILRQLYAEHARPLLAFVLRLTGGDRQRAEDVVQETLLRAWRNIEQLGGPQARSARPWLVTVARRIVIDDHRGAQARPQEALGHDLDLVAEGDHADRVLRALTLTEAMRTLTPAQREILVVTYVQGLTVAEAARRVGVPLGTATSRIFSALAALRTALTERGVTP